MSKYIQSGNCDASEFDGEWIVLHTDQLTITKLNDMGGFCWSLLEKAQSSESLARSVINKFSPDETEEQIQEDMEVFLESLLQCGLIQPC